MFDILVYLFENYSDVSGYPDPDKLTRKLAMAGFADGEIRLALDWLTGLSRANATDYAPGLAENTSFRCYAPAEMQKIDAEGRGFISFLEQTGMLDPLQREQMIDWMMAMDGDADTLEKIKLIVLIDLWIRNQPAVPLVLEELVALSSPGNPRWIH